MILFPYGPMVIRLCEFSFKNLYRHHPTIIFTPSWSANKVAFLNTRFYLRDGLMGTDLHVKPRDTHQYLQMDSCHPHHCKISIPYSQALYLRLTCLKESQLQKWTREHLLKCRIDSSN